MDVHFGIPKLLHRALTGLERSLERGRLAWLDGYPFWVPRLRRALWSHHKARVEVGVARAEADAAQQALTRAGWVHLATNAADADDRLVELSFAARVRSGSGRSATVLARKLTVALADAKAQGLHHFVIDVDRQEYDPLPEWRSTGTTTRVFTRGGAPSALAALRHSTGRPAEVEPVGTLTGRLRGTVIAAREALERDPAGGTAVAAAFVTALVVLVYLQHGWPDDLADDGFLWLHHGAIRLAFVAATALWGVTTLLAKRVPAFRLAMVLTFGVFAGILLGGSTPDLLSLQTVYALTTFGVLWILWELAALARWGSLIVALRVGTVAGVILGYGQWRLALYYAGMGIAAGEVDVPTVDSLTMGLPPLVVFTLPVAFLLLLAWIGSGWSVRMTGMGLTIVAVATGASLLLDRLSDDERLGRAVGAGTATPARPGVRTNPSPTEMCLVSVGSSVTADQTATLTDDLPRIVWRVGTFGQQTLVLDPERARAAPPVPPDENVSAPIWYLPTNQVTLHRTGPGAPCTSTVP